MYQTKDILMFHNPSMGLWEKSQKKTHDLWQNKMISCRFPLKAIHPSQAIRSFCYVSHCGPDHCKITRARISNARPWNRGACMRCVWFSNRYIRAHIYIYICARMYLLLNQTHRMQAPRFHGRALLILALVILQWSGPQCDT